MTKFKANLRPEPVIGSNDSEYQITPKPVVEERSLLGSLSRFPSGRDIISKRPKLWGVLRDANRDKAILDTDETSASSHAPVQASLISQHQNPDLMETAYNQDLPRGDMSKASRYPSTNVDRKTPTRKTRVSLRSSSMEKLNKDSLSVGSAIYGDVGQSKHTSRPSLKSIANSLRHLGKTEVTPFCRVADSSRHVDTIKQTSQFATSVVDRPAGSSLPPEKHASSSCSLTPPVADSRHSLALISPIRNPYAKHDNDTSHLVRKYRRSSDDVSSPESEYLSVSSETQSPSSSSTSYEPAYGSSIPQDEESGNDVDAGYQS